MFYNNSAFDGRDPAAGAADDAAVAADKRAAPAGAPRDFAAITGYARGLNGIIIDVLGLPAGEGPDLRDFAFRAGTSSDPSAWANPVVRPAITVRRGAGAGGSDRITLIFPDSALRNTWLEVTLLPTGRTGLVTNDVFAFGNLVGDTGATPGRVDAADLLAVRTARRSGASAGSGADINRDGVINVLDEMLVRANQRHSLAAAPPAATAALAFQRRSLTARRAADYVLG